MNVKITYAVPFERVPNKVNSLLDEASRDLEMISDTLKLSSSPANTSTIIAKLDNISSLRKKLLSVDLLLEDCYSILASYNKALAELKMPNQTGDKDAGSDLHEGGSNSDSSNGGTD